MKTKKKYPGGLFVLFLILTLCFSIQSFPREKEQEAIKHEVSVTRVLIPLFAYDSRGNPVFDLKMEDIRLFVNGKAVGISDLNLMQFEYSQEIVKKVKEKRGPTAGSRDRVVFMIVDTMFNSIYGIRNAKRIVSQFIESDSHGIQYVIMENSLFGGLKLIGGPETDKSKLKKFLKKIHRLPDISTTSWSRNANIRQSMEASANWQKLEGDQRIEKERIKYFYEFLAGLKYALQSINQPKMILLVSEGIPELLFYEVNPYVKDHAFVDTNLLDQIKKTVKAINEGGGILFAVYSGRTNLLLSPRSGNSSSSKGGQTTPLAPEEGDFTVGAANIPIVDGSGIESLKSLALGTGGRYFDEAPERVVKEIQDTTAAYYEVAFSPGSSPDGKMNISIKCKRKGIRMDFPSHIETSSYKDMNKIQKKVFALNVVLKRNWTWALAQGKAREAQFGWLDDEEKQLQVTMPAEMNGHPVDIFIIRFDKDFRNPHITMESRTAANTEILKIPQKGNDNDLYDLYMVIIEPQSTACIYNRIK